MKKLLNLYELKGWKVKKKNKIFQENLIIILYFFKYKIFYLVNILLKNTIFFRTNIVFYF